ncbi:hypothetical protein BV25DRAFT_1910376 [Artomyces pyxidatus]|uniref:Uncharacterized protein n=1 Tax=Artomyces pyxidatus TaxID=48021 RepID=A0ACB8TJI2_9AGAM|nr:hypothetical protein BV25DRAFT_1910376 [Artomyces pyxidatus]
MASPRRSHRKRYSALTLSSDTTATLPEYSSWRIDDVPPPDYPQSADEADADTDESASDILPPLASPRTRRFLTPAHRRRHSTSPTASTSSTDPYLDSLLARSVHALEMSNALLQSSMTTHSSLSTLLGPDPTPTDTTTSLEARANDLSARIRTNSGVHAAWLDDLNAIAEHAIADEDTVSRSLPTTASPLQQRLRRTSHARHRSSFDLRTPEIDVEPQQLALAQQWPRARLVSPAPRALTQYVESSSNPDLIQLPSTIGVRSSSSTHFPPEISGSSPSLPTFAPILAEPPTPAYTLLSSFLSRRPSTSTNGSRPPRSRSRPRSQRRASSSTARTDTSSTIVPSRATTPQSQNLSLPRPRRKRPSSSPPAPLTIVPHRPLTPPTENLLLSSSSSESPDTDPHPNPVLSLQALRKILDEQPQHAGRAASEPAPRRAPQFLPRTPRPSPTLGTSTATASISRLFTKSVHMHGTAGHATPRHSALKTPTTPSFGSDGGSRSISGSSTPKRISFAELPESYAGGGSGRGFGKKRKGKGKGKEKDDAEEGKSWWTGWLLGGVKVGGGFDELGRERERDRAGVGAARRQFGGIEEWTV